MSEHIEIGNVCIGCDELWPCREQLTTRAEQAEQREAALHKENERLSRCAEADRITIEALHRDVRFFCDRYIAASGGAAPAVQEGEVQDAARAFLTVLQKLGPMHRGAVPPTTEAVDEWHRDANVAETRLLAAAGDIDLDDIGLLYRLAYPQQPPAGQEGRA